MSGEDAMPEAAAKAIMQLIFQQAEDCNDLLLQLHPQVSPEEFRQCAYVVGAVLAALYDEGLRPIFKRHPHLKPEGLT